MISKIVHILLSQPSPEAEAFEEIKNIFLIFWWIGKPHKFKLMILEKLTADGGLQFSNIRKIEMALKANNSKLPHRRTVHNKLLFEMVISEIPNCLF